MNRNSTLKRRPSCASSDIQRPLQRGATRVDPRYFALFYDGGRRGSFTDADSRRGVPISSPDFHWPQFRAQRREPRSLRTSPIYVAVASIEPVDGQPDAARPSCLRES